MKYSFSTTDNGMHIEIISNANISTVRKTIDFNEAEPFDKTMRDMIDNMRLTVKEREQALVDFNMFKSYLYDNNNNQKTIMITE